LSSSLEAAGSTLNSAGGRRCRRSWSDEDKQRIVDEAVVPGASVADIARRHGVNANLVFNWRKAARAASSAAAAKASALGARGQEDARPGAAEACEFIPIGVLGRAEDGASALAVGSSPAVVSETSSRRTSLPRPGMEERPGVIEIDLADGVRLRVDAFVNERALRRVLAVLKVTS
jgi:transposase